MSDLENASAHIGSCQLGPWRVLADLNRLQGADGERLLEPRVMVALQVLIEAQGKVVSDELLLESVWRGQIVSDASLYKVVGELRKALGDASKPYRFIERVNGKGYRLLLTCEAFAAEPPAPLPLSNQSPIQPLTQPVEMSEHEQSAPVSGLKHLWWTKALVVSMATLGLLGIAWLMVVGPDGGQAQSASVIKGEQSSAPGSEHAQAEQRPVDMSAADWQDYLQARWHNGQRKPAEVDKGIALFERVLNANPDFAAAGVELCNSYHLQHLYGDWPLTKVLALCDPLLRSALQHDASSAAALASFGQLKMSQDDIAAAQFYLDKALQLSPDDAMALLWRGALHRRQGQPELALQRMRQAEKRDPLSGIIKRNLAFTLAAVGELHSARQVFAEALLLEPDYANRAIDEIDLLPLNVERARNFLRWAKKFPDRIADARSPIPAVNLALVQMSVGLLNEADLSLAIAERHQPVHPFALVARAMWLHARGQPARAAQVLQQRAQRQPDNRLFALSTLLYGAHQTSTDSNGVSPSATLHAFEQLFPEFKRDAGSAIEQALQHNNVLPVLAWLTVNAESNRARHRDLILRWLAKQEQPDSVSLNLYLLLGQTTQANQLATDLLNAGWLPSPNEDFYLAEQNPLWQELDASVFILLNKNRSAVISN